MTLGLGVVGAGAFAEFVASAASGLDEVAIVAVTDLDETRAQRLADQVGAAVAPDVAALLADDRVGAVVVATPPSTHAALAVRALQAGRHVFCEKPTALGRSEAAEVRAAVARSGRTYVVDHVLRYNPVLNALARLRDADLLGPVQRLSFENDAADEDLPPGHWFWDETVSGGIFVEHGVHFFDAAAMLLDDPAVRSVQALGHTRASGETDTVVCTVAHADGALASYAHGFSHAHRAERQLMRLDCGLGEVRVHGWIPLRAELDVWTDRPDEFADLARRGGELLAVPGYRPTGEEEVEVLARHHAAPAATRARGVARTAPHHVRAVIDLGHPAAKQRVYAESVRAALHDLATCARTGTPPRAGIDEGVAAVEVAAATRALHEGRTHHLTAREAS